RDWSSDVCSSDLLINGPVFRAHLILFGDEESRLILSAPHLVADGWSWGLIVDELGSLYLQKALSKADSYRGFIGAELDFANSSEFKTTEAFWKQQFATPSPPLELPFDRSPLAVQTYQAGNAYHLLESDLVKELHTFCRTRKTTPYAVLLACYQLLLHRLTGQNDIVIGTPIAGQPAFGMPN